MSWTPSSKGTTLVVLLALLFAAVGTAGALSIAEEDPVSESRVGETVTTTVVIEDPFQEQPDAWTLRASTELENVSWVVTVLQQGNQVSQEQYGDQSFEQDLDLENGGDEVRIELTGDTPAVTNWSYDPRETYVLWDVDSVEGNSQSNLNASETHHFTNQSRDARQAIDEAAAAVNESDNGEAGDQLNRSVEAYDSGNFDNAVDLANDAQDRAEQAQQSQEQTQTILYGVGALVVLALVGGGAYYWRSQQDQPTKLQ